MKYSKQREAIKEFLKDRKDHPTADVVYMGVKENYPNISLGTVYRNLSLLAEKGEIARISLGDGVDHFDPDTSSHYHFLCTKCGCVSDIIISDMPSISSIAQSYTDNKIINSVIYFQGTCKKCHI